VTSQTVQELSRQQTNAHTHKHCQTDTTENNTAYTRTKVNTLPSIAGAK